VSQTDQDEGLEAAQSAAVDSAEGSPEPVAEDSPGLAGEGGPELVPEPSSTVAGETAQTVPAVRREPQVRTVDFSQPTKFTAELRRRIVRVLSPFCEAFAIRLSSELRVPVELTVADSSQLTWAAAKAQLHASAIAVALEVQPIERQILLGIEPSLTLQALECLLGGTAAQAPADRRLSEIDWSLTRRLLESMTTQLTIAWRDLGALELTLGEIDLEGDAGVIAPIGEPTFAITLESRIEGLPSTMSLLIPWSAIEPLAEDILGGVGKAGDANPQESQAVHHSLATANVRLRAEVGCAQMPVEQMLALTPGALLALEDRAEDGVQLYAEGVPICRALPGLRGTRRAIKLTTPMQPGGPPAMLAAAARPLPAGEAREGEPAPAGRRAVETRESLARMLGVPVRVWAELGRTTLPLGHTLELPPGSVVELDQAAEAPIELFVNGMCFAHGTLQVTPGGEWAVHVDALI
jgi:flagellar motor switch protein FliM